MPASLSRPSRTVAAAEAAGCLFRDAGRVELNSQEHFCLSWERWAEELAAAVAARQPWPLPPQSHEAPAPLLRLAEAAMNAFAAVWSGEVECQRLLRQVQDLQSQARSSAGNPARGAAAQAPLGEKEQQLAKALLQEEQEVWRLREREKALSEQLAAARASARKLKEQWAQQGASDLERQAALQAAKRHEMAAKQQFQDREAEIQSLRQSFQELSGQLAKKDAVQASLSKQIRQLNMQLQQSEQQRERLLSDLQDYLLAMREKFDAPTPLAAPAAPLPLPARALRSPKSPRSARSPERPRSLSPSRSESPTRGFAMR
ncbi:unnamed protein product [Effrenium voratum]|nr:unnamed protein product [Effrenium voratum]